MYTVDSYLYDDVTEDAEGNVTLPSRPLHHLNTDYYITDATLEMKMNKAGTFTFTIPVPSESNGNIEVFRCVIVVRRDGNFLWAGRPIAVEMDIYGNRTYTVEGILALLNDIYHYPAVFNKHHVFDFFSGLYSVMANNRNFELYPPDLKWGDDSVTVVFPGYVSPPWAKSLTTFAKMEQSDFDKKYIKTMKYDEFGTPYETDLTINRWWKNHESIMDLLQTRIIDYFGGFIEVYESQLTENNENLFHLRYLDPEEHRLNQKIEIGKNILEVSSECNASDFYTCFIPVENIDGEEKPLLTTIVATGIDTWFYGGLWSSDNETWYPMNYVFRKENYIANYDLFMKYGLICKKIEFSFDANVTDDEKRNQIIEHAMNLKAPQATFTVKAIDLSMVEEGVDAFQVGHQVQVICDSLGIHEWMTIEELSISLNDPTNCTVTLNGSLESISKLVAGR